MDRHEFENLEIGTLVEKEGHWQGIVVDLDESDDTVEIEITDHEYDEDLIGDVDWYHYSDVTVISKGANKTSTVTSMPTPQFNSTITTSEVDTAVILGIIK